MMERSQYQAGRAVGFYNCGWFGSSIFAAYVTYGCNFIDGYYRWARHSFSSASLTLSSSSSSGLSPSLLASSCPRAGKRKPFLTWLDNDSNGNPNTRLVGLEVEGMNDGIRVDGLGKTWWDISLPFEACIQFCIDDKDRPSSSSTAATGASTKSS